MYITNEKFKEIKAKHNTLLVLEGDVDEAAEKEAELEKLVASPGWRAVW